MTYLHLLVLPRQLSTELLQLLLHADGFTELRPALILLFLQLIRALLTLDMISVKPPHVRQQLRVPFLYNVQLRHWRLDAVEELIHVSGCFLDFSLYINPAKGEDSSATDTRVIARKRVDVV